MTTKVLLIEDDSDALMLTSEYLQDEGMEVYPVESALSGLGLLNVQPIDIIVLDLNLPDYNGFDVCAKIRNESGVPIIIVSGNRDVESRLLAFSKGADDYLGKPIDLRELVARIHAILKRVHGIHLVEQEKLRLIYDQSSNRFFLDKKPFTVTPLEKELLLFLLQHRPHTVSRDELAKALPNSSGRTLDYHIKNIRKKLGDDARNPYFLKTEYGNGYRLLY